MRSAKWGRLMALVGALMLAAVLLLPGAMGEAGGAGQLSEVGHAHGVVGGPVPVQGLLVVEYPSVTPTVTIISLTGKRLPVPARVRESPFGLSPDARMVAGVSADAVRVGAVRGGSMRTVLRGSCPSSLCPYGAGPSFAWSPDSRRLAVSVELRRGPTLLKLADRNGRVVRSFTLPRTRPEWDYREYHRPISWSPDGSRLLLERRNTFGPTGVVALDIDTGRLRALARLEPCQGPRLAWSPDGRFVALTASSVHDCQDRFAVVDAASARPIIDRVWEKGTFSPGSLPVWAPDSRSLFLGTWSKSSRIDRFYLNGRRSNVIKPRAGWLYPRVALGTGLVYQAMGASGYGGLYLQQFATGHRELLITPQSLIEAVLPLSRIP